MANLSCSCCSRCSDCSDCSDCFDCFDCSDCKNLVHGFMCYGMKFKKKDKSKYWIFNKKVTKKEWDNRFEIKGGDLKDENSK